MPVPPFALAAGLFAVALGIPFGLYALLTRGQRRTTREIRVEAVKRGWKYRRKHWQGDPTSFRIDGSLPDSQTWIMTTQGTGGNNRGWTVRLGLRFPMLGGEEDFVVEPRKDALSGSTCVGIAATADVERRVAAFSEVVAREIAFYRQARELWSGSAGFDAGYRILALPERMHESPIGAGLADRMLRWPADAVQPNSMRCWRDPYGLHIEARLPGAPNWATVSYLVALGGEMIPRVSPPVPSPRPGTFMDRILDRMRA